MKSPSRSQVMLCVLPLMLLISACGATTVTVVGAGGGTVTATTTTTCAPHPAAAVTEAWVKLASAPATQQVSGSLAGGAPTQLSHLTYPLGVPGEDSTSEFIDQLIWSPDAHHLALAININAHLEEYPYILDPQTHVTTRVPVPASSRGDYRVLSWIDSHTLLILPGETPDNWNAAGVTYSYDLTTNAVTPLPGITRATDGVVRCGTLYYLEVPPTTTFEATALLHRYNLATRSEIGTPISLGDADADAPHPYLRVPGWDVAQDGTQLVFQRLAVSPTSGSQAGGGDATSQFFKSNVDGSAATPLFTSITPHARAFMAIAPNGMNVAVAVDAVTAGDIAVFSGSLNGSSLRSYQRGGAGYSQPAWLPDSSGFDVEYPGADYLGIHLVRNLLSATPGVDGLIPGTTIANSATGQAMAP